MVVHNFNAGGSRGALRPLEADPPLIIDPNTPLPLPVSLESFQPIAAQPDQISQAGSCFEPPEPHQCLPTNAFESPDELTAPYLVSVPVTEAQDHPLKTDSALSCVTQHTTQLRCLLWQRGRRKRSGGAAEALPPTAHEPSGFGAGRLAALEHRGAGDQGRFVAVGAPHEALAAGGEVVDHLGGVQA